MKGPYDLIKYFGRFQSFCNHLVFVKLNLPIFPLLLRFAFARIQACTTLKKFYLFIQFLICETHLNKGNAS